MVRTWLKIAVLATLSNGAGCSTGSPKGKPISMDAQYDTAVHEAGHAVANHVLVPQRRISSVYVLAKEKPGTDIVGLVTYDDDFSAPADGDAYAAYLRADAVIDYAGAAAEKVVLGTAMPDDPNYRYDGKNASDSLWSLCLDDRLADEACKGAAVLKNVVGRNRSQTIADAAAIVEANKAAVIELANLIMRQPEKNGRRTLNEEELYRFLADKKLVDPKAPKAEKK